VFKGQEGKRDGGREAEMENKQGERQKKSNIMHHLHVKSKKKVQLNMSTKQK